jgi:hypothetical protein
MSYGSISDFNEGVDGWYPGKYLVVEPQKRAARDEVREWKTTIKDWAPIIAVATSLVGVSLAYISYRNR